MLEPVHCPRCAYPVLPTRPPGAWQCQNADCRHTVSAFDWIETLSAKLAEAEERIARLQSERDRAVNRTEAANRRTVEAWRYGHRYQAKWREVCHENNRLRAENERLRTALQAQKKEEC